jgi:hypothetical protein
MGEESVVIHDKSGKKICSIDARQGWWSWFTIPTAVPFLGIRYRNVWREPEKIIKWAWIQSFQIVQSIREPTLISRQTRCHCLACDKDSVTPVYGWLWAKNSIIGFRCLNKNCSMFKIRIPAILTQNLLDMPEDLLAECLIGTGQTTMITWIKNK